MRNFEYTNLVISQSTLDPKHFDALRKFKAEVFQVLVHPPRIHIIETLRDGELSVGSILAQVKVEPANLSQHLSVLRGKNLVLTRKAANQVLYSLRDPLLVDVLEPCATIFNTTSKKPSHFCARWKGRPRSSHENSVGIRPKLLDALKTHTAADFRADLIAGITVGVVALPLAMAFAIASGVPPEAGIFPAVIAGFIISGLGGTRVAICGPTGAFIVILYGINVTYGPANLAICTIMAGVLLLIMGFARLGTMIKYIPYPVTTGFTSGIAVLIFSTQIKDFCGLTVDKVPSDFIPKMKALVAHAATFQWPALLLAAVSLAIIRFWPGKFQRRVPGSIVALALATAATAMFHLPVETIGSRFGGIPQALPAPHLPALSFDNLRALVHPAMTIALLAAIESLLCAVVADGMIDDRHDSNQELIAQGLANIASPIFGGIAATGAIARTATNVKCGARSPVAGMIHAATLLAIILVAAPLARFIPLAALSAVLVHVAMNMGEWHNFARLPKWPRSDAVVYLCTFAFTIIFDLTVAVQTGMILAALLFIKRVADTTLITAVDQVTETEGSQHSLVGRDIPKGVMVYRIFGSFFFGAADKLEGALKRVKEEPDVLILRMRKVLAMDATGLNTLEDLYERLRKRKKHLVLSGPHTQPLFLMDKAGFLDRIGRENVCANIEIALVRAREILHLPPEKEYPQLQ